MFFLIQRYFNDNIKNLLSSIKIDNTDSVCEIRLRKSCQICLCLANGEKVFSEKQISDDDIKEIIDIACKHSLYYKLDEIKNGYISLPCGIRMGIAGEFVYEQGIITGLREITSVNIRLPHVVTDICKDIVEYISSDNKIESTLIVSAPGAGKTTLLKDIIYEISRGVLFSKQNICIIDERCEITTGNDRLGNCSDILRNIKKTEGIDIAIRSLAPEVLITDEIGSNEDLNALKKAKLSGITIIATMHANGISAARKRLEENKFSGIFSKFVYLSDKYKKGRVVLITDSKQNVIYEDTNYA